MSRNGNDMEFRTFRVIHVTRATRPATRRPSATRLDRWGRWTLQGSWSRQRSWVAGVAAVAGIAGVAGVAWVAAVAAVVSASRSPILTLDASHWDTTSWNVPAGVFT